MPEPSPYPSNLVISNLKKNVVVKLFSYLSFTTLVNLDPMAMAIHRQIWPNMAKMAIYFIYGPCATNMGKQCIPEKNIKNVAQQC